MSLRSRLLLVVLALVVVGLAVTDVVTYRALRSFLLHRVDQQLVAAQDPVGAQFTPRRRAGEQRVTDSVVPSGTFVAVVDPDGQVLYSAPLTYPGQVPTSSRPSLDGVDYSRTAPFTVDGTSGSVRYRAQVSVLDGAGNRLLIAIPLNELTQTLHRLLAIEGLASALVLLLVGAAALVLVRAGLRPLEQFGEVAGAIAEGDLSRRVPVADARTEVGRLGLSLNAMLGQIQSAFEARQASEDRLRRFVADASHELRTPLTSIRGYAELFRRGAADRPDDLATAMRRIEEESSRMSVLVDDLLLLARLDQGRPLEREPVDLTVVAADAVGDARAAHRGRTVTLDAPPRLVVTGDEQRLRQVAANLLANACQHTPPGTAVDVRVALDGGGALLEVADHGPGLPTDAAEKVFERFYRADPSRARPGGSGLGLSIVAAIAAAHGGTASASSTPGGGACFRVTVPGPVDTGDGPAPAVAQSPATPPNRPGSRPDAPVAASPWAPPAPTEEQEKPADGATGR